MEPRKFPAYCQRCVWETHPQMMTTYCLRASKCDRCGYSSDLALVLVPIANTREEENSDV